MSFTVFECVGNPLHHIGYNNIYHLSIFYKEIHVDNRM